MKISSLLRFDHFGSLCELFPVGIPVLALCLAYLRTGKLDDQVRKAENFGYVRSESISCRYGAIRRRTRRAHILFVRQVLGDVKTILKCNRNIQYAGDIVPAVPSPYGNPLPMFCDYPGSRVLFDVLRWDELKQQEKEALNTNYIVGWMSPMNRK